MSPPLSQGSAPLDADVIATLKEEIAKPHMNADRLRKRLSPPVSGATFWRALHGHKVSLRAQAACGDMARTIREQGHSKPPLPPFPYIQPTSLTYNERMARMDSIRAQLAGAEDAVPYDFDPDPEVA